MTIPNATITRRIDPCNCGCRGQDSWHLREYTRTITDVEEQRGACRVHAYTDGCTAAYRRTGLARLPWGEGKPVRVVELVITCDDREVALGWYSA